MYALILFILLPVSFGSSLTNLNELIENTTDLENALKSSFTEDEPLDDLGVSLKTFIQKIKQLIVKIEEDSTAFLENLEIEKLLELFNSKPCLGVEEFKHFKKSFIIEVGLLKVPLRGAMAELQDKLTAEEESVVIEKAMSEVQLVSCQLLNYTQCPQLKPHSPCLNDSCSSPQSLLEVHNILSHAKHNSVEHVPLKRNLMSTECADGKFRCTNGECTSMSNVCTGIKSCNDYSDERTGCPKSCPEKRCRNLQCVAEEKICNGVDDCGDGTDEENCINHNEGNCSVIRGSFLCKDKLRCLPLSLVCDGQKHCVDGSDEGSGCTNSSSCAHCASVGGACLLSPDGSHCLRGCPLDYFLDLSSSVCIKGQEKSIHMKMYKSISLLGIMDKVKVLSKRFLYGYFLLKKHMYQLLESRLLDLNNCMRLNNINNNSLSNPFLIL